MNELTGLAIQQRPNNSEALARSILTQLSRNSHEPRSISARFAKIDKLKIAGDYCETNIRSKPRFLCGAT
jgi:hypothetical protein